MLKTGISLERHGVIPQVLDPVTKKLLKSHNYGHFLLGALKVSLSTVGSMGYMSLLCCSVFQVSYVYIFHTSSFPYSSGVTVCVRLQIGNPLRFSPRGKNLAWGCALMFISKWCWHIESKSQEIYQQIVALKAASFESWSFCSFLFRKLAIWHSECFLVRLLLGICTQKSTLTCLCLTTSLLTVSAIFPRLNFPNNNIIPKYFLQNPYQSNFSNIITKFIQITWK